MRLRFYLLDLNEDRSSVKPTVRLWGVDDDGRRVLVLTTHIMPYFYYLPGDSGEPESVRKKVLETKKQLPKILRIESESKKLLGHTVAAFKVTCAEADALVPCARELRKVLGGQTYEQDLRLAPRYVIDGEIVPCAWHDCEIEPIEAERVSVDCSFVAMVPLKRVEEETIPKMRILAFTLVTLAEKGSAKPDRDPIRILAAGTGKGKIQTFITESDDDSQLLRDFISLVKKYDPDVIVGFQSNTLDWPYLLERSKIRNVKLRVGRDQSEPHTSMFGHVSVAGRANLDLFDIAGGIPEIKVKTIQNLADYLQVSSAERVMPIEEMERYALWMSESGRRRLAQNARASCSALLELAEAAIHYPMQLSSLTGLPLDEVMAAAVGFRVDSYLIKQAHAFGELIPPRIEQPFYTYRGAIVREPKPGLHNDVFVLDFSSMYPRLMIEYNLSPDTLVRPGEKVSENAVYVIPEVKHRFRKEPEGFYRTVLLALIDQRNFIKQEMTRVGKESTRYKILSERERAVKVLTNACYGYAGWAGARWYAKEVAESASALGREAITRTISKAKSIELDVIYGDTDSVFVKNDRDKVQQLTNWVEHELGLEIRTEREYTRVLFTEAMKRYAGLLADGSLDIVGLEVVRGDWSGIARQVQEQVLTSILRDQSKQKAIEDVRFTISRLRKGGVPIEDLTIRKSLTKRIEDYAVRTPHVEVAKKLIRQGWNFAVGDKVAFVITKGPGKLYEKAKAAAQVRPEDVDTDYYVENQIIPSALRILELFSVDETELKA